ncbi:MAG: DUF5103 domain-containing protein [Melioribacteraceae bacterium]|jgi:hypothetical protein|nr:DUF5103 domain-containing protein [Melioribacteraceae bacterium]
MKIKSIKNTLIIILLSFITITAQDSYEIKSLRVFQTGNQTSFPISLLGSKITIEFDIKGQGNPNWEIVFLLCDNDWQPYESGLLIDGLSNTERNLWFETLPFRGDRASYHYKGSFPNENVKFPLSGKWMFFIQDIYNSDLVYGEGKFYVVNETATELKTTFSVKRMEGRNIEPAVFGEVLNIKASVSLPDSLFADRIQNVEIIENRKIEDPILIDKSYDNEFRYYEIDDINSYSFFAKNIHPGGAYRQVNLTSRTKHSPPKTSAHFDGIEVSNKFSPSGRDYYGGSKLVDYQNTYSEYMDVEFKIRPPEGYYQNIFLVGSFTNWDIYPEFRMEEKDGLFTTTTELKRGVYDYQYVVVNFKNNYLSNIDWIELEGNSWSTKRNYYIFLFYETEDEGGYDKIIAYKQIRSKNK